MKKAKKKTTKTARKTARKVATKTVWKQATKGKRKKPVTVGDMHRKHGGNWGDFPADMPAADYLEEKGAPIFAQVFRKLIG